MKTETQTRTYKRAESAVFSKTKEAFGGLSNMAAGFPVRANGIRILTSEALYQACRFPHRPEVQRIIIGEPSPMTAKMKSKPYRKDTRQDWDQVRVKIMRWCLRVKLVQNWRQFSELLLMTGEKPIVEESRKDDFWGAKPVDDDTLVGMNVLGRLLMELREEFKSSRRDALLRVEPLPIPDFLLNGQPIETIVASAMESKLLSAAGGSQTSPGAPRTEQTSLFDQPSLFDQGVQELEQPEYRLDTPPSDIQADKGLLEKRAMVAGLKPYTEYKESGISWLGEIPLNWNVRRMKLLLREVDSRSSSGKEQLLRVSQYTGVTQRKASDGSDEPDTRASSLVGYKRVAVNDLVINIMLAWNGSMGVSRYDGIASPAYCVYRFKSGALPWYYHELLRLPVYKGRIKTASTGVVESRLRLYSDDLGRIEAIQPPPDEQAAIVRFLDHANRRLERAIRAKRKVIALLSEQKQAIIHRAVTRGLDPDVPLKPSGIPWLGESPAHWKWIPIKRLLSRMDYGTSEVSTESGRIRVLTMGNIQKGEVIMPRSGGLDDVPDSLLLEHHDLLFTRTNGNPDLVGKVGIFRGKLSDRVSFASYLVRLRVKRPHEPQWLHMLVNSSAFWPFARSHALVNLQTNLNSTRYGQFPVPVPPPAEQVRIVEWVGEESKALNTAITRLELEIELLREYRTRLVTDVVTGKLDVREAARHLPAEVEAPEALPETDADDTEELEPLSTEDAA